MSVEYDLTDLRTKLRHANENWRALRLWLEKEKAEYESMRLYGSTEVIELVLEQMSEADGP